jgi:S1-C subfamily serine protease
MSLPLEPAPENPPREPVKIRARSPFAGATMITLSPAVAEEMRIDNVTTGVVVAEVEEGTTAEAIGFQRGDVVLEVNGERVTRSRELDRLAQNPQRAWRVQINRGGKTFSRVIGG